VFEVLMGESTSICTRHDATCDYGQATKQWEGPLWQLITQQPDDWLPAQFENWQSFFESMANEAWLPVQNGEVELSDYTWGKKNTTQIKHPLSNAIPLLGILTDMSEFEQSGDTENIPHISGAVLGQSERIVVSPGHEEDMNLPSGQSGHPLSPYYGEGHDDWLEGKIAPFLPQETKWKLEFIPAS
jgi:penicillin G amidase